MTRLSGAAAERVTKIYGRQRALAEVSLALTPGKTTALLGPNGSGKTTLLNLFSTLSRPTSGQMIFGQLPPERAQEARGRIGLVSHASLAYGDLSGLENVIFYARLYGVGRPEARAKELLEELGLVEAMGRPARTYSRGMTQRLSLARALVSDPDLVLLDEPFTGLDPASSSRVVEIVKRLRDRGAMVLLISHDLPSTARLADEIVILSRGKRVLGAALSGGLEELQRLYAEAAGS
ncbi:MAG: ABC transporter ATP-binding protein [Myxococcota bacterium]